MPFKDRNVNLQYWRDYSKNVGYPKTKARYKEDKEFRKHKIELNQAWCKKHNYIVRLLSRLRMRAWREKKRNMGFEPVFENEDDWVDLDDFC